MATSTYSTVIKIDDEQRSCSSGRQCIDLKTIKSKHYVQFLSIKKRHLITIENIHAIKNVYIRKKRNSIKKG